MLKILKKLLAYNNRLYNPNVSDLKQMIIYEYHNKPYVGHPNYQNMLTTLRK